MNKKLLIGILLVIVFVSAVLSFYNKKTVSVPRCLNSDEAAFGYNAYSILKTGKDEYGTLLPLRLKSFGDFKLPLYSYLSVPFIALFGLNTESTRLLNLLLVSIFPLAVYFLTKELFHNQKIALIAASLSAISLAFHSIGRQAHESLLAVAFLTLSTLFFIKLINKFNLKMLGLFFLTLFLSLFAYHISRIFAVFFFAVSLFYPMKTKTQKISLLIIFIFVLGIFALTDLKYNPARVENLLFFNNQGFSLKINELNTEGGISLLHNIIVQGITTVTFQHLSYFSPQFLVINGDDNPRFGYPGISLLTPFEYIFIFIGIYFAFRNKERFRNFVLALFIVSPLSASLSWNGLSLTRSIFLFVPCIIFASYGMYHFVRSIKNKYQFMAGLCIAVGILFFAAVSWEFYLFHYPQRGLIVRSWECGYKELTDYVEQNYNKFDKFYITKKNGEPYIFFLFFLKYPPALYQKYAKLTPPDKYGFGQVEGFDKFDFNFDLPKNSHKYVAVGFPDDFQNTGIDPAKIKKIKVGTEDMFWIYESP